jgi:hypothetical protein
VSVFSNILTDSFYPDILSKIIIGFLLTVFTSIINAFRIYYSSLHGKYRYVNILRTRFPRIDEFLVIIRRHKINKQVFVLYYLFVGFIFGVYLMKEIVTIITYVFNLVHIFDYLNYIPYLHSFDSLNIVMIIVSLLNITLLFIAFFYFKWDNLVKVRHLSTPKITKYNILAPLPILVFMIYWIFIGIIFGVNFFIYLILCNAYIISSRSAEKISLNLALFGDVYKYFGENVQNLNIHGFMYLGGMLLSFYLIANSYTKITLFNKDTLRAISNFYYYDFPYVKIKTDSGESKGQLRDILNKSLVTLNEKNILTIIPWDKIETMEASQPNRNEYIVFDNDYVKDK